MGILLSALLSAADASVQRGYPGILDEMEGIQVEDLILGKIIFFTFSENVRFPNRQLVILDRDLLHRRPEKIFKIYMFK